VAKIDRDDDRFWIAIPEAERAKLASLVERSRRSKDGKRKRWLSINADRLIAWQLNWRGENFWSGGEIYQHHFEDGRTVYMETDNKKFLEYINAPARNGRGRKFWIITEKSRLAGFPNILPSSYGKKTWTTIDNSSNKFGLGYFVMDEAPPQGAPPPGSVAGAADKEAPPSNAPAVPDPVAPTTPSTTTPTGSTPAPATSPPP
jgi:hypothetical protein